MKDRNNIDPMWLRLWKRADRISGRIIMAGIKGLGWLLAKLGNWVLDGLLDVWVQIRRVVIQFVIKVALWALLTGLFMLWAANGFDLSDTFSWAGLQTLIRTWR